METNPIKINKKMEGVLKIRKPIFLISCSSFNFDVITPKPKYRITKDIVEVIKQKIAALYDFKPTAINKIPNWVDAIFIINLFKLFEKINKTEKYKIITKPNINKKFKYSKFK